MDGWREEERGSRGGGGDGGRETREREWFVSVSGKTASRVVSRRRPSRGLPSSLPLPLSLSLSLSPSLAGFSLPAAAWGLKCWRRRESKHRRPFCLRKVITDREFGSRSRDQWQRESGCRQRSQLTNSQSRDARVYRSNHTLVSCLHCCRHRCCRNLLLSCRTGAELLTRSISFDASYIRRIARHTLPLTDCLD